MTTAASIADAARQRAHSRRGQPRGRDELAREATRLRKEMRTPWREVAQQLGYTSWQAARSAAVRYGGYTPAVVAVNRCKLCGSEVENAPTGRPREYCDECQPKRVQQRAAARQAEITAALPELRCVDCGRALERTRGRQPDRCPACQRVRRRQRERDRDRRRAEAKMAHARAVGYTSAHWKRVRDAAIARAKRCADCGSTKNLSGHLANVALEGDHRRATIDDVEVLCLTCHGCRR